MMKALLSTFTEIADSKKWIGSYVAAILASVLHVYFGVSIENALLLASPITLGVLGQAHVDAATAKGAAAVAVASSGAPVNVGVVTPPAPPTS